MSEEPAEFDEAKTTAASFDQVLAAVRSDLGEELGPLLEEFRPYLLAIAMEEFPQNLGGKLGASDLVQDTIIKGFENFGTFHGTSREELAGWLRRTLLNHLANVVKSYGTEKRDVAREQPVDSRLAHPGQSSPSGEALSREQWGMLQGAMARLPEDYRRVILLRHRENLSYEAIGRLLNRTEEAARKLWGRAIRQLQQELG